MYAVNWAGVPGAASIPSSPNLCFTSGMLRTLRRSALTFSSTGPGSPAGASRPHQLTAESSGRPDSFIVGTVGIDAMRISLVTANGLSVPAWMPVKSSTDIRTDKWSKLLINVAFNPLGAISHLGFGEVLDDPEGERLARALMDEALEVARACGLRETMDVDAAFTRARNSRLHRTSMLQDVQAGRRLELDPILGVLLELGGQFNVPTQTLATVYSCMRLIDLSVRKGPIRQVQGA